jgi:predicted RNase H-like HicB family nuclease
MRNRYFEFIEKCGELLGRNIEQQADMVEDVSWFGCYDDGMTPEEAVKEYKEKVLETDKKIEA